MLLPVKSKVLQNAKERRKGIDVSKYNSGHSFIMTVAILFIFWEQIPCKSRQNGRY